MRQAVLWCVVAGASVLVWGCGGDSGHGHDGGDRDHGSAHGDGDHDHGHGGDDDGHGHDHDGVGHHDDDGHGHDHGGDGHGAGGTVHDIDPDAFGGRQMQVEVAGSLTPGSDVHVEGDIVSGPATYVLRLWVGTEDGLGSVKARAEVRGGHFHVHVPVPSELPAGSALWLEAMGPDGERQSVWVPVE